MPTPKAQPCTPSTDPRQILEQFANRVTNPPPLVPRSQFIFSATAGINNTEIAKPLLIRAFFEEEKKRIDSAT